MQSDAPGQKSRKMKNTTTLTRPRPQAIAHGRRAFADDVIDVGSHLDSSTSKRFGRSMARWIERGNRGCIFDMSAIEAVDSSGFGSLIAAVRKVEDAGGASTVVCTNPTVRRLFEVAGVTRLVPVVSRLEDARTLLAAFERGELAS
jgi:stage II sporulation protein AA (anti-sigma F factor antagonist)